MKIWHNATYTFSYIWKHPSSLISLNLSSIISGLVFFFFTHFGIFLCLQFAAIPLFFLPSSFEWTFFFVHACCGMPSESSFFYLEVVPPWVLGWAGTFFRKSGHNGDPLVGGGSGYGSGGLKSSNKYWILSGKLVGACLLVGIFGHHISN